MRTVSVPVFRNESNVTELGSVAARQIAREFQRDGTFRLAPSGEAAIEIQGVVKSTTSGFLGGNRKSGMRSAEFKYLLVAEVSVVDKRNGRVLIDGREYRAETSFMVGDDLQTALREHSGRLAEALAEQVVDDVLGYKWQEGAR